MQTTFTLTTDANAAVEYIDGVEEKVTPLTLARLTALPAGTRNVRKAKEPTEALAGWLIERKARARRVRFIGEGEKVVTLANGEKVVTTLRALTVSAKHAASIVGLDPAMAAAFVARFPSDGSAAPEPKDAAATAAAFRKVNAHRAKAINIGGAKAAEVLA